MEEKKYTVSERFVKQFQELWDFFQSFKRMRGDGFSNSPLGPSFSQRQRGNRIIPPRQPLLVNIDSYTQANGATWHQLQPGTSGATVVSGGLTNEKAGPAYEVNNAASGTVLAASGTNGLHAHLFQAPDANGTPRLYFVNQPRTTFPVKVTKDGGSDGNQSGAATWTYTVKDLAGTTLGTTVSPIKTRPNGKMTYAGADSYAIAFYDGATLKLWDVVEVPGTVGACA